MRRVCIVIDNRYSLYRADDNFRLKVILYGAFISQILVMLIQLSHSVNDVYQYDNIAIA